MNLRQGLLMTAAMVVAITVEVAREKSAFAGIHPIWIYVGFGVAGVLVILAFLFPGKKADAGTSSPTINVYPPPEPTPTPVPALSRPLPPEPQLILGRVWKETLFRMGDGFFFHSRIAPGMLKSYTPFHAVLAEIRNAAGHARNIKAELAFENDAQSGRIGPLTWAGRESNTVGLEIGDSEYVLLAVYLVAPFTKMSDWRIPVNTRRRGELPGATLVDLSRGVRASERFVRLHILHPDSGSVVKTFSGAYQWPGDGLEPKFSFAEQANEG